MDNTKIAELFIESIRASQETTNILRELVLCLKETSARLTKLEKDTKTSKRAYSEIGTNMEKLVY